MYNAAGTAAASSGALAMTGLATGQYAVAGLSLIALGAILLRHLPRRKTTSAS